MLGTLIETHGYWVLALGCLLEGETVLVLAGFAAHRGYLDPAAVFGIAAAAGFCGDQVYFWLGRRHGPAVLTRWPSVA
ncbi:MAG TPA: DedA family protein, partial [Burkholderiaceae bacterium]|nr:DedA family protein [Burkholderiaceae bacterium]